MRASILLAVLLGVYSNAIAVDGFDEETGTLSWPQYRAADMNEQVEGNAVKRIAIDYLECCDEAGVKPSKWRVPFSQKFGKYKIEKEWLRAQITTLLALHTGRTPPQTDFKNLASSLKETFPQLKSVLFLGEHVACSEGESIRDVVADYGVLISENDGVWDFSGYLSTEGIQLLKVDKAPLSNWGSLEEKMVALCPAESTGPF